MPKAYELDAAGYLIGDIPAQECNASGAPLQPPAYWTNQGNPSGLRRPRFVNGQWQHGETAEEARAKIPDQQLADIERAWRDQQLAAADIELAKIADFDTKLRGTEAAWRNYRRQLRALPELPGFPRTHTRPEAPQ